MRKILESHSEAQLRAEIKKSNITGFAKMSKAKLIDLMLKHKERFTHLKYQGDAAHAREEAKKPKSRAKKAEAPKPAERKKPAPKPAERKKPAPKPAERKKPAPKPAERKKPAPKPASREVYPPTPKKKVAPKPAERKKPAPKPAERKKPAPKPAERKKPSPKPAPKKSPRKKVERKKPAPKRKAKPKPIAEPKAPTEFSPASPQYFIPPDLNLPNLEYPDSPEYRPYGTDYSPASPTYLPTSPTVIAFQKDLEARGVPVLGGTPEARIKEAKRKEEPKAPAKAQSVQGNEARAEEMKKLIASGVSTHGQSTPIKQYEGKTDHWHNTREIPKVGDPRSERKKVMSAAQQEINRKKKEKYYAGLEKKLAAGTLSERGKQMLFKYRATKKV